MGDVEDGWKDYKILFDNKNGEIFKYPWYGDLVKSCKNGESIEDFLAAKDKKRYEAYLATDKNLLSARESLADYSAQKEQKDAELNNNRETMDKITAIRDKISDVLNTFPPSRRREAELLMEDFARSGTFDENKIAALQKGRGLWDKLKNASKYKKGSKKLAELMDDCRECKGLAQNEPFKRYFNSVCKSENSESLQRECLQKIERQQEESVYLQTNVNNAQRRIDRCIKEFPPADMENQIIREFVAEKGDLLASPPDMAPEEVKTGGLSEKYVEGVLLNSKYPQAAFASMRRFYEELKDPVAPRVAFNHRSGNKVSPQAIVDKLREKGLDAVLSTDERAADPNVFAVDENSIHAPFLNPKDALKANVMMVESIKDLNGTPALSNPMMRESMVRAVEQTAANRDWSTIDNYQKNLRYNQDDLKKVIGETFINWGKGQEYSKRLNAIMQKMEKKEPETYNKIYAEIAQELPKYTTKAADGTADLTPENENLFARELIQNHLREMAPYIYEEYQKDMINGAFANGMAPLELDSKAKQEIIENGHPLSVFHGGKQGANPYAVLCSEHEGNMCFIYGAATVQPDTRNAHLGMVGNGSLGYAFEMSSHNKRSLKAGEYEIGFLYEYESRKDKQEMLFIDTAGNYYDGGKFDKDMINGMRDETTILPHQNKLKKLYVAMRSPNREVRLQPLDVDDNGKIVDKKWREFVEMYNPIDDNVSGNMAKRRNNMIEQYDTLGKEGMYRNLETAREETKQGERSVSQTANQQDKAYNGNMIHDEKAVKPEMQPSAANKPKPGRPLNQEVLAAVRNNLSR